MRAGRGERARSGRAGFTLMELLVAIGILALLAGLLVPVAGAARRSAAAKKARAVIERVKLACEGYHADFGDYPPTSLAAYGLATNGLNEGSESLVRCLTTRLEHGPYLEIEDPDLVNLDGDALQKIDPCSSMIEARTLFELADPWGSPYFYFHCRDYQAGAKVERYTLASGARAVAKPRRGEKTGQFPNPTKFLIWSAGPNGENENGQGDDVCSWK